MRRYSGAMRVIVLGASGFLSAWAIRSLVGDGHLVTAVARPGSDLWRLAGVDGVSILRAADAAWPDAIEQSGADALLSLDWSGAATSHHEDDAAQLANLPRQAALIGAAARAGVTRIVGVGSQTEYGVQQHPIAEEVEPDPATAYGRAKVASQRQLADLAQRAGIHWVWARVFSLYGPLDADARLLPSIADAAATGSRIALTPATQPWSYLAAPDAGRALALLATDPGAAGIVNVAHPEAPPLRQHIEEFAAVLGATGLLDFGAIPPGSNSSTRIADIGRLRQLGWEPRLDTATALRLTAEWLRGGTVADPVLSGTTLPTRR